jgi:hypothetical protein
MVKGGKNNDVITSLEIRCNIKDLIEITKAKTKNYFKNYLYRPKIFFP